MKKGILFLLLFALVISTGVVINADAEKVTAYVSCDEAIAREVLGQFTKTTGIQVDWVRLATGEAQARITAEKNNPQASIWVGGVGLDHISAKVNGLTTPYVSPKASKINPAFKDKDGYWCGFYVGPLCFVYNTKKMEEKKLPIPKSWADLTKKIYKGQIEMANPQTSGTSYNVITTVLAVNKGDEKKMIEYMKKLNANVSQYTQSGAAPGNNCALGETPIALGYSHDQIKLISKGYPLKIGFPKEGTGFEVASISLIKGGPQLETAKKLYDYMLGEEAGKILANSFLAVFVNVPLRDGAMPLSKVKVAEKGTVTDEWAGANKDRLVKMWLQEVYGK